METILSKDMMKTQRTQAILLVLSSAFGILALAGIIFHFTPLEAFEGLIDFAKHHYLFFGLGCGVLAIMLNRYYILVTAQLEKSYQNGLIPGYSKKEKRKAVFSNANKVIQTFRKQKDFRFMQKERLKSLYFADENTDVLTSKNEMAFRSDGLQEALCLGNLYKREAMIYFKVGETKRYTHAVISRIENNVVTFKSGGTVPVQKIYKINI